MRAFSVFQAKLENGTKILVAHSDIAFRQHLSKLLSDSFDIKTVNTGFLLKESLECAGFELVIVHSGLLRGSEFDIDTENCLYIFNGKRIYSYASLKIEKPLEKIKTADDIGHIADLIRNALSKCEQTCDIKISSLIHKLGFDSNLKGSEYIVKALEILTAAPEKSSSPTKEIYPEISKMYKTSPEAVERSIRNSLEKAWNTTEFRENFKGRTKRPSNGELFKFLLTQLEFSEHLLH